MLIWFERLGLNLLKLEVGFYLVDEVKWRQWKLKRIDRSINCTQEKYKKLIHFSRFNPVFFLCRKWAHIPHTSEHALKTVINIGFWLYGRTRTTIIRKYPLTSNRFKVLYHHPFNGLLLSSSRDYRLSARGNLIGTVQL